ncbi:mitochondrial cytochrome c oxidase subunit VIa [Mycena amicta]|nr:mitochondrial cytochrome c oxidase subunit VIa [Mycena amicta]
MLQLIPRRALLRSPGLRAYSDAAIEQARAKWLAEQQAIQTHALQTTDFWRKMSYYVCLPALAIFGTYVYNVEIEHKAHNAHLMAENDGKLPQPPRYEYLNRRTKGPYPWGPNSLFFNPQTQRDMSIDD